MIRSSAASGSDVAALGGGDDVFVWNQGDGSDIVDGQSGSDTLVFNGASGGERFDIPANGAQATLFRDAGSITMRLAGVERIDLATLGGADAITVNDLAGTGVQQVAVDLSAGAVGDGQPDTVTVNATAGKTASTLRAMARPSSSRACLHRSRSTAPIRQRLAHRQRPRR